MNSDPFAAAFGANRGRSNARSGCAHPLLVDAGTQRLYWLGLDEPGLPLHLAEVTDRGGFYTRELNSYHMLCALGEGAAPDAAGRDHSIRLLLARAHGDHHVIAELEALPGPFGDPTMPALFADGPPPVAPDAVIDFELTGSYMAAPPLPWQ